MQQWASGWGALGKKEGWLIEKGLRRQLNITTSIIDSICLVISSHFTLIITHLIHARTQEVETIIIYILLIRILPKFLKPRSSNTKDVNSVQLQNLSLVPCAALPSHSGSFYPSRIQQVHVSPLWNIAFSVLLATSCPQPSWQNQIALIVCIFPKGSVAALTFSPDGLPFLLNSSRQSTSGPVLYTRFLPATFSQNWFCPLCNHPAVRALYSWVGSGHQLGTELSHQNIHQDPFDWIVLGPKPRIVLVFILHLLASLACFSHHVKLLIDALHLYSLWLHLLFILTYSLIGVRADQLVGGEI